MIRLLCKPKTELFKINFKLLQIIKLFPYTVCLLNVLGCYMVPLNLWKPKEEPGRNTFKSNIHHKKKLLYYKNREYTQNI